MDTLTDAWTEAQREWIKTYSFGTKGGISNILSHYTTKTEKKLENQSV